MSITAVAVVACLATATTVGRFDAPVSMVEGSTVQLSAKSLTNLPSWLRTSPVKLVPLAQMEREQMLSHKMSKGYVSEEEKKKEAVDAKAATPRELAMHNVTPKNAAKVLNMSEKTAAKALQLNRVKKAAAAKKEAHARLHAKAMAAGGAQAEAASKMAVHKSQLAAAPMKVEKPVGLPQQLQFDKKELEAVAHGETQAVDDVKLSEAKKMAFIKAEAGAQRAHILKDIQLVNKEMAAEAEEHAMVAEKAKLKAKMAALEHEENQKIQQIKKHLEHEAVERGEALATPMKVPAVHASPVARAHAPVTKAAVKVVHAATPAKEKAPMMSLAMVASKPVAPARLHCQGAECADKNKWTSAKFNVDKIASAAQLGNGHARTQALARMRELQKQIEADSHSVIGFGLHEEHEDPGAK